MRSFISFQPGEQRSCAGCHESRAVAPVPSARAVSIAAAREPSLPLPPPWGDRPVSFLRDIQPVLDRYCVRCHTGLTPAGDVDLSGGLISYDGEVPDYGHNRAYDTVLAKGLVSRCDVRAQDASITPPLAYGSRRSRLITCLTNDAHHGRFMLSEEDRLRLVVWIDANAPYHDTFVNKRASQPAYNLAGDERLFNAIAAVHERRCTPCHVAKAVTRLDWIDLQTPPSTLFITAPLADGRRVRKCSQYSYRDRNDPDYVAVRRLVEAAVEKSWEHPRRDLASLDRPPERQRASAKPGVARVDHNR